MILIITQTTDVSTFSVCEWLMFMQKPFEIINEESSVIVNNICLNSNGTDFNLTIDKKKYHSEEIKTIWFRRGGIRLLFNKIDESLNEEFSKGLFDFMMDEMAIVREFIVSEFVAKAHIGNLGNINKLNVLKAALEEGFNIPDTLLTKRRSELITFVDKHKQVLSKVISENIRISSEFENFKYPNSLMLQEDIDELPEIFQLTLFQQYIPKKYEIRTFIAEGKFYSMAIFSQSNPQTMYDYRNYVADLKTRCVPILLTDEIKKKLLSLMQKLNLNSGSVDLIYSSDGEYYFLEVNPVGQFGNVSYDCNYNIEKEIAEIL